MILTNGERCMHVSEATYARVREGIANQPGLAVPEYAVLTEAASSTINVIIAADDMLWGMACAGQIAVSPNGPKPNWFRYLTRPDRVPVRRSVPTVPSRVCHGLKDAGVARDIDELVRLTGLVGRALSPRARRQKANEMAQRVVDLGKQIEDAMVTFGRLGTDRHRAELKTVRHSVTV